MSEPFLAEIKIVGFTFAPRGWAFCDGQIVSISQNQSLFSLVGTKYGGDGQTTFALPDLRGRTPFHVGNGMTWGEKGGAETHTLTTQQMPTHEHSIQATSDIATSSDPTGRVLATAGVNAFRDLSNPVDMDPDMLAPTGGGQGHNNMAPYLVLNFVIALQGLFPSRN